jgi:hypothetical protein
MRYLIACIFVLLFAVSSFADELDNLNKDLAGMKMRLLELDGANNALAQIKRKHLEDGIAETQKKIQLEVQRRAERDRDLQLAAAREKAEGARIASLTPDQRQVEERRKAEEALAFQLKQKQSRNKYLLLQQQQIVKDVFSEAQQLVEKTHCVAASQRKGINLSDWGFRTTIATCQKFIQSSGLPQVDCLTCSGTFTYGNGQYKAVDGGQIVAASITAEDGMVLDMTAGKIRVGWPQSGHYIVYDISQKDRVRVTEINSYIAENMVKTYLQPEDEISYSVNTLFRKIDSLFEKSELPITEFSRLVFNAAWLEKHLKNLK